MPVQVRILGRRDAKVLSKVLAGVFDHRVDPKLARAFLGDRRHHIAVAVDGAVVVGFASGVDYIHPDKPPEFWINEVSVAPAYRRRSVGKNVLSALLAEAAALGCADAWVLTYRGNGPARSLYKSLGGIVGADRSGPSDSMLGYSFRLKTRRGRSSCRLLSPPP